MITAVNAVSSQSHIVTEVNKEGFGMTSDAKKSLAWAKQPRTKIWGSQEEMTVSEMDERMHSLEVMLHCVTEDVHLHSDLHKDPDCDSFLVTTKLYKLSYQNTHGSKIYM